MSDPVSHETASPPIARLRQVSLGLAWLTAMIVTAIVVLCDFGTDSGLKLLVIVWNWLPILLVWLLFRRTLTHRSAWTVAFVTLVAMMIVAGLFLVVTLQQVLVQFHGFEIEGVQPESLFGLISLFIPLYVGGVGVVGLATAIAVELRRGKTAS